MSSKYTIPVIPQNLSKEETIIQIVEVLDHLNNVTQDILSRVNSRIQANNEKLLDISQRIDIAASKVEQLKGAKKATRVFSSSKYPAVDVKHDYLSVFADGPEVKLERHEVKHTNYSSVYEPLTKLQFFHVKVQDQLSNDTLEGLGNIPQHVNNVNDLLLFNTGKNLYKEFTYTDSLKGPVAVREREHITTSELGAAPQSISERSSLHKGSKESYFYTPKVEELPALDVPLDLPDLPGIADDLRYEFDIGASIAPSITNQNQMPEVTLDLPNVLDVKDGVDTATSAVLPPPPPPPPPLDHIPPPPPPVLPPMLEPPKIEVQIFPSVVDSSDIKDGQAVDSGHVSTGTGTESPPHITSTSRVDSRASLMEAIRKAGGSQKANLRKTKGEEVVIPAATNNTSSGDLMADLHSKLMMRRKGISGAKKVEEGISVESTLAKMSSMIPPPVPKSDVESSDTEDDWND